MTAIEPLDVDDLPPTQWLVLDVLAARYRTGSELWTFPASVRPAVRALVELGLVDEMHGTRPKTIRASLTEAGKTAVLMEGWENPAEEPRRLLVELLRRSTGHVDGRPLLWPDGLGAEPAWFDAYAVLADPVLSERYGLTGREKTP